MSQVHEAPQRSHYRFFDPMRVRWAEVDLQKIVFNGHYLMYFDTAVAGYWRAMALPYHDTMQLLDGDLYVRKATVEYLASAKYDDALKVGVRTARVGNSSMTLQCAVFKRDQPLVHGELVYVFADPATQTSRPIPMTLRETLSAFESRQAMTRYRSVMDASLDSELSQLMSVLDSGEQIRLSERSEPNKSGVGVLMNRMNQPVAALRWAADATLGQAQLFGLIVRPELRQSGLLQALLAGATGDLSSRGYTLISCKAEGGLANALRAIGWRGNASRATLEWRAG